MVLSLLCVAVYPAVAFEPPQTEEPPPGCVGPAVTVVFEGKLPWNAKYGSVKYIARPAPPPPKKKP